MDDVNVRRAEAAFDLGAGAALGAAAAWTAAQFAVGPTGAGAVGLLAFAAGFAALRLVRPATPIFALAEFAVEEIESSELLLTEVAIDPDAQELVLDDVLPPPGSDARVVRLFDASAMPTPGELQARIDRHLAGPEAAPPDASQALFDALAELRSTLR